MKIDPADRLPEALVAGLDPARLQQYVRSTGWRLEPRLGKGQMAVFERPESRLAQIAIPLTRDLTDFAVLLSDAVAVFATWEKRPALEVLGELLLPPADVLRFCESGPAADAGNLPFDRGFELLAGIRKTLLAAACGACRPQRFYPRLTCEEAEQFLHRCRLCQTERGSFVVTVACPLDPDPENSVPFARRVTLLLMRALDRLAGAVELSGSEAPDEDEPVLSVNLCEGVLGMAPAGEGSSLTVSANWERTLPLPAAPPPESVRLPGEAFGHIEALAARLRQENTPGRHAMLGFVEALVGRTNRDRRREGSVVLALATAEGEFCRARAELDADTYARAAEAHLGQPAGDAARRAAPWDAPPPCRGYGRVPNLSAVGPAPRRCLTVPAGNAFPPTTVPAPRRSISTGLPGRENNSAAGGCVVPGAVAASSCGGDGPRSRIGLTIAKASLEGVCHCCP
jgi:hypothetical protein